MATVLNCKLPHASSPSRLPHKLDLPPAGVRVSGPDVGRRRLAGEQGEGGAREAYMGKNKFVESKQDKVKFRVYSAWSSQPPTPVLLYRKNGPCQSLESIKHLLNQV
jgi:hypothetical protein